MAAKAEVGGKVFLINYLLYWKEASGCAVTFIKGLIKVNNNICLSLADFGLGKRTRKNVKKDQRCVGYG